MGKYLLSIFVGSLNFASSKSGRANSGLTVGSKVGAGSLEVVSGFSVSAGEETEGAEAAGVVPPHAEINPIEITANRINTVRNDCLIWLS